MNEKKKMKVDIREFLSYGQVKDRIVYRLINTERNRELLNSIPHMEFMDLSIIFKCIVKRNEPGNFFLQVHNSHMKLWGVSVDELYKAAEGNTPKIEGYDIRNMAGALCDILKSENPKEFIDEGCISEFIHDMPLYVLSNKSCMEGSACMLYPDLLRDFANALGSSFYIIPSSIHELLLLPMAECEDSGEIRNIIREINDTQVQPEEILSYSLYCYDREYDKIFIC